ncbi:prepilin-type N-terminal cleavage/methylation domain-containing protein [Methylomonas sp. AM2-LC]|uniref:type IV pilus modification PilV family protein n=1 Tax=Methylomonas sp. AM2-LC TaxID=3153301 RepID=UPI003267A056
MIRQPKGFSLLEILVAFSIMAVAITIVLRIFGSGVNNAIISEEYNIAVQIAESIMARTGVEAPMNIGETSGVEGYKYHWLVSVNVVGQNNANNQQSAKTPSGQRAQTGQLAGQTGGQPGQAEQQTTLFAVKVLVIWGDEGSNARSVELRTLKLG